MTQPVQVAARLLNEHLTAKDANSSNATPVESTADSYRAADHATLANAAGTARAIGGALRSEDQAHQHEAED